MAWYGYIGALMTLASLARMSLDVKPHQIRNVWLICGSGAIIGILLMFLSFELIWH